MVDVDVDVGGMGGWVMPSERLASRRQAQRMISARK